MIRVNGINLTDKAYEAYSATDPLHIELHEDGTISMTGAFVLTLQDEGELNRLLEDEIWPMAFESEED